MDKENLKYVIMLKNYNINENDLPNNVSGEIRKIEKLLEVEELTDEQEGDIDKLDNEILDGLIEYHNTWEDDKFNEEYQNKVKKAEESVKSAKNFNIEVEERIKKAEAKAKK